ncbi:MAG: AzlC family ABC transporter permease [Berryella intestinalis]|uniref:AzlC family ABC transporter permease n=1 Tax=Berryella intestinalis TaxID=1531429 RepID=UPI002A516563|nr:AzlC family ABC transporter permease [Berryella intestinalis]MDD7369786.1 AzlC family ABC transporter permease [Berryella intestinalis]MDY3129172.1 AzlC family ABC transporter permease [Berryella intestinalis]
MLSRDNIQAAFGAAFPIVLGYVAIGIPCGILSSSIGMNALQVLIMCLLLYSGAGQFMIPNMWLAASPVASIVASVSLVNMRHILYSTSITSWVKDVPRPLSFFFAATITDESFGVNMNRFLAGDWSVERATWVNCFSWSSWTLSCVAGTFIGSALNIPLPIAAFAMTSIFICLMVTQKMTPSNVVAIATAVAGVFLCKLVGLSGPAILLGATFGVVAAIAFDRLREVLR